MTIAISQWTQEDSVIQARLNELKPHYAAKGCIGLQGLTLVQDRPSIQQRLDSLFPGEDSEEDEGWIKNYVSKIKAYLKCGNNLGQLVILFVSLEEADALIIYTSDSNKAVNVNNDNWSIISVEPLLLMSMYGTILGIIQTPQGPDIVALDEGDPGWSDPDDHE